ncbi:hypothetical protein D9757_011485 [Collybiopsis confluens]|uniref:DDE Tnp4 domain-containing protein n=1 Tax=Collybiopsis confluens TaxID=2823264 RepID=A0A8H5LVV5_9AGAR|nr:hypothetical protein D9757_011485 [Collybiopsis confluens]
MAHLMPPFRSRPAHHLFCSSSVLLLKPEMQSEFLSLLFQQQLEEEEDETTHRNLAILGVLAAGIADSQSEHARRRNPSRRYLTRPQLMPDPRAESPWVRLWQGQEDRAFITTMGFDVATFRFILEGRNRFADIWDNTPIPREDVSSASAPRPHTRSLDAAGALGLVLHYLGSAIHEVQLQQIFAVVPSVLTRYLKFSLHILLTTLRRMNEARIKIPSNAAEYEELSALITARHPLLEGAFGSIDGLSLAVQVSEDPELENATYNGWKTDHRITNVLMFSPKGTIIDCVLNAPGSWHDAHTAKPIFERLRSDVPSGFYVVSDTAFPRGPAAIQGKIQAPMKGGERIPADPVQQEQAMARNRQLLSYRQTAEWGMRIMQGSFGRLRVPLPISNSDARQELLEICCRLTNVRAICVGINQIRSVYLPTWKASEDDRLWDELGNMLFGEIRRVDRVARFHVVPVA